MHRNQAPSDDDDVRIVNLNSQPLGITKIDAVYLKIGPSSFLKIPIEDLPAVQHEINTAATLAHLDLTSDPVRAQEFMTRAAAIAPVVSRRHGAVAALRDGSDPGRIVVGLQFPNRLPCVAKLDTDLALALARALETLVCKSPLIN